MVIMAITFKILLLHHKAHFFYKRFQKIPRHLSICRKLDITTDFSFVPNVRVPSVLMVHNIRVVPKPLDSLSILNQN